MQRTSIKQALEKTYTIKAANKGKNTVGYLWFPNVLIGKKIKIEVQDEENK
jgi:hypothetical protein|tara:strand:- start:1507 stop:1659 length:153 start_codon:yes stop_codon:yes gene_type:complete